MSTIEIINRIEDNRRIVRDCIETNRANGWISTACLYRADTALIELLEDELFMADLWGTA